MDEYDSPTSSLLELNSRERGLRGAHASDSLNAVVQGLNVCWVEPQSITHDRDKVQV